MIPARWPREEPLLERLLHVDPSTGALRDARIGDLPSFLRRGDVLVVNDAATLPGSLRGRAADGTPLEARILLELPSGAFRAVLFDGADWRTPTQGGEAVSRQLAPPRISQESPNSWER